MRSPTDEIFMQAAMKEAKKAVAKGEWPVGCVLVVDGKIVARGHNQSHKARHKLEHAEMMALRKADTILRTKPLDSILYTTCEPCPMCIGACIVYKIKRVVAGANPEDSGGFPILSHLPSYYQQKKFALNVTFGILEKECLELFQNHRPR